LTVKLSRVALKFRGRDKVDVPAVDLFECQATLDRAYNILILTKCIVDAIDRKSVVVPSLRPSTPLVDQAVDLEEERVSREDAERFLSG
jgi:hypothetical protein